MVHTYMKGHMVQEESILTRRCAENVPYDHKSYIYPAESKGDKPFPPVYSQASLHICAV